MGTPGRGDRTPPINPYRPPRWPLGRPRWSMAGSGPHPLAQAGLGLLLGAMSGVTAGATAGGIVALVHAAIGLSSSAVMVVANGDAFVMTLMLAAAFAGVVAGGIAGGALGLIIGLLTVLVPNVPAKMVIRFSGGAYMLAGSLLGGLLSERLGAFVLVPWPRMVWPLDVVVGGLTGWLGGLVVGRSLTRVSELHRRRKTLNRSGQGI